MSISRIRRVFIVKIMKLKIFFLKFISICYGYIVSKM